MKIHSTPLKGLALVELKVHGDERGFFVERFREEWLQQLGIQEKFVQENHSRSAPGVLRGMHFQTNPPQGKLVGVTRGKIWDIAVDIRKNSPTFGHSFGVELSDTNGLLLWVPYGFAHGLCVMGNEPADVIYKVTGYYNPDTEGGFIWNDSDANLKWPEKNPLISARDQKLPRLKEISPL